MSRESGRRSSFGPVRLTAAAGAMALLALAGCATSPASHDLSVVARDASTGATLEGVRFHPHVATGGATIDDVVATTDAAGEAVFPTSGGASTWIAIRDGYEPLLVKVRDDADGEVEPAAAAEGVVVPWSDVLASGMLELPMTPITWRTVWISVVDSETGAPVARATVVSESHPMLDVAGDGSRFGTPVAVGTRTDGSGVAMIDLPSGSRCTVDVVADGHAATQVVLDPASPDGVASHTTVQLQAYRYEPTRVVVLDRGTGLPVAGATIRVGLLNPTTGERQHDSLWETDAEGMAVVMKPAAGLGTLLVEHDGRAQSDFRILELHATEFNTVAIGADDLD